MKEGNSIVERPDPNEWWEKTITIADLFCCGNCKHYGSSERDACYKGTLPEKYCTRYKFDGLTNKQRMIDVD